MQKWQRLGVLAKRFWRVYVQPPKETGIFLAVSKLSVLTKRIARVATKAEPKQVAIYSGKQLAFVSCMRGQVVQAFDYSDDRLEFVRDWEFDEQCVEVEVAQLCSRSSGE